MNDFDSGAHDSVSPGDIALDDERLDIGTLDTGSALDAVQTADSSAADVPQ